MTREEMIDAAVRDYVEYLQQQYPTTFSPGFTRAWLSGMVRQNWVTVASK